MILIIVLFSLMHLLVMGQANLTNDEAQYALYGYYPDWSYFDHPPLSGWLNAIILSISDSDFALRVWPLLLSIATSLLIFGLSKELFPGYSQWLGTISVLVYQSSIISQVLALAMLPDTPLIPLTLAAYWSLLRALKYNNSFYWLLTGSLFGLAGLSKYTAITLVFTAIAALFIYQRGRVLRTPWPWLGVIIAGILIIPVIYWNMQHDWISINYQLKHGAPETSWQLTNLFISQLLQIISYSPAVYIFGLVAIVIYIQRPKDKNSLYILAMALPALILFNWNSGYEPTLPHWTAIAWVAISPLIARIIIDYWQRKSVRVFCYLSLAYSFSLTVILHLLLATNLVPFKDNKHPLEDLQGWEQVSQQAVQHLQEMQADEPSSDAVILVGNWSQFARLAWYARPHPVQVTDSRYGQSDMWYGSVRQGTNGILVVPPNLLKNDASGLNKFKQCKLIENFVYKVSEKIAATYPIYRCYGYKG